MSISIDFRGEANATKYLHSQPNRDTIEAKNTSLHQESGAISRFKTQVCHPRSTIKS